VAPFIIRCFYSLWNHKLSIIGRIAAIDGASVGQAAAAPRPLVPFFLSSSLFLESWGQISLLPVFLGIPVAIVHPFWGFGEA